MSTNTGSSPRGRGKPISAKRDTYQERLIPAWAGKTCALPSIVRSHGGSSPRGRGKRGDVRRRSRCGGLIPAWAGKTRPTERTSNALEAHPRVGGENLPVLHPSMTVDGSSPRGRGKRHGRPRPRALTGLIPAWAGKTDADIPGIVHEQAHPRVGGENDQGAPDHGWPVGSSPRGRGKL